MEPDQERQTEAEGEKWYVLAALHPVQAFIRNSRKTQDLRGASYIVAELAKSMAEASKHPAARIKLPPPESMRETAEDIAIVPHESLFEMDGCWEDVKERIGSIEASFASCWEKITEECKKHMLCELMPFEWAREMETWTLAAPGGPKCLWDEQCKGYFQFHYAAVPGTGKKLKDVFREITRLLASVKNTQVRPPYIGDSRSKCTLCGEFEQCGPPDHDESRTYWQKMAKRNPGTFGAGERLCSLCLVKRIAPLARKLTGFPSIATVAMAHVRSLAFENKSRSEADYSALVEGFSSVWPELQKYNVFAPARQGQKLPCMDRLVEQAQKDEREFLRVDGQFFMPETIIREAAKRSSRFFEECGMNGMDSRLREEYRKLCSRWRSFVEKNLRMADPRYFGMLILDVDRLGRKMAEADDPETLAAQIYGYIHEHVRPLVEDEHLGKLIYAGGDDILAFMPYSTVLPCAMELRRKFRESTGGKLTISASIVCAHVKENLRHVLRELREGLSQAKNRQGWIEDRLEGRSESRNVLGIRVLKHSGRRHDCVLRWTGKNWADGCSDVEAPECLKRLVEHLRAEKISPRFVHNIGQRFAFAVAGKKESLPAKLATWSMAEARNSPLAAEIRISLLRQLDAGRVTQAEEREQRKRDIESFVEECQGLLLNLYYHSPSFSEFFELLHAAVFLATGQGGE